MIANVLEYCCCCSLQPARNSNIIPSHGQHWELGERPASPCRAQFFRTSNSSRGKRTGFVKWLSFSKISHCCPSCPSSSGSIQFPDCLNREFPCSWWWTGHKRLLEGAAWRNEHHSSSSGFSIMKTAWKLAFAGGKQHLNLLSGQEIKF